MNPREILLARQHSYQLLGNLFLNGVGEADRPVLAQLPELAPHLPEPFEADDMAATHQSLFGFNLLPYESVFLTAERVLGGHISDQLARQAGELRFYSGQSAQMDHIGQQLLLLAYLCGAELNMLDRGEVREAALWARAQADWLAQHLLTWLAPFSASLLNQAQPFFAAVGDLTLNVLADHWRTVYNEMAPQISLPAAPDILADEKAGLKEIGNYLMTPVYVGLLLTRDDLSRLGRQFRLPRGFGSREQMMTNLLRSAAQYDEMPQLMTALAALLAENQERYAAWQAEWPGLVPFIAPWGARLASTIQLANDISAQAA